MDKIVVYALFGAILRLILCTCCYLIKLNQVNVHFTNAREKISRTERIGWRR